MLVKMTQIINDTYDDSKAVLKTVYVNPDHMIKITEDLYMKTVNTTKGPILEGLDTNHSFSRLSINSGAQSHSITVIGSPESIMSTLKKNARQLIKG